jgi:AcrR family transcriptional regulator
MPTPTRTSLDDIVAAARALLESDGLAGLTMQAVASHVGVRAPSLYKHVGDRDDLIRLVSEATVADLGNRMAAIGSSGSGSTDTGSNDTSSANIAELAREFRRFAHEMPAGYHLVFAPGPHAACPSAESLATAVAPLLAAATALAGPGHALDAARTLTAWANGFLSMELSGSFNLGGDVNHAWEYGLASIIAAISAE